MGKQRVKDMTGAAAGGDLLVGELGGRHYIKPCPLSVLGVQCSADVRLPTAPAEAFGDMAAAFPSQEAIREAGGYAMALALADQPVPAALCCDRTVTPASTPLWF